MKVAKNFVILLVIPLGHNAVCVRVYFNFHEKYSKTLLTISDQINMIFFFMWVLIAHHRKLMSAVIKRSKPFFFFLTSG